MLYLIKFPSPYGNDVILKHFDAKPEALGFLLRLNRLLGSEDAYLDSIDEQARCPQCNRYLTNLIRSHKIHGCELG